MLYTLRAHGFTAEISTHGGELISLRDDAQKEYIWNGDPAFWTGRNPILFPIVGNLKENTVRAGDFTCRMNRHGFARNSEFTLEAQTTDSVTLALTENEETLSVYPYPFCLRVTHTLTNGGFETIFSVTNTGSTLLPFCIGAHTAVRCPLGSASGEHFKDYVLAFEKPETADALLLTADGLIAAGARDTLPEMKSESPWQELSLNYDIFSRIDTVILDGLHSKRVALQNKKTGRGIRLDFSDFPLVAFWTKPGAPYLCMEPWHGMAAWTDETGRLEDKPWCIRLKPGEIRRLRYSFTLL